MRAIFVIVSLVCLCACFKEREGGPLTPYDGPLLVADTINGIYTDSGSLKFKFYTNRQMEFQNGDREYPLGLKIAVYKNDTIKESSMRADFAHHYSEEDYWIIKGNVLIKNLEKHQQLETQELYWKPGENRIWTEEHVKVTTPDQILTGKGLTAKDDFSEYELLQPEMIQFIDPDEI